MATPAALAKMYRQRIPTPAATGKTGPRQTTVEDVRRVATYGRSAMTPSYQTVDPRSGGLAGPVSGSFQMSPEKLQTVQSGIIGGPGAGYGQKYGGFATQSDFQNAIRGEAFGVAEVAELARQKAQEALSRRSEEFTTPVAAGLSRSASMAGVRPGALMSAEDRAKLMGGYQEVQKYGSQPEYVAAREQAQTAAPGTQEKYLANQMMRAAYEDMYYSPEYSPEDRMTVADLAVQQGLQSPQLSRYATFMDTAPTTYADIGGPLAIAEEIDRTPISQYAQQIAQARYGMDPNLARGLFGADLDMDFAKDQINARQMAEGKPILSDDQLAWELLGPDGYNQYRERKILEMAYGSPEEQAKAEEDAFNLEMDLAIKDNFGFMPSDISGVKAETLREVLQNPDLEEYVKNGIVTLRDTDKLARDYFGSAKTLGNELAQGWMSAGGDPVEAQIIQRIFSSFDFTD